jgi:hypothetical protein
VCDEQSYPALCSSHTYWRRWGNQPNLRALTDMRSSVQAKREPSTLDRIEQRIEELQAWLEENASECIEEQRHLDANTPERAYWHYGYMIALRDLRDLLTGKKRSLH